MPQLEQKFYHHLDVKALEDDGSFSGHAAIFNKADLGRDIIIPGAFTKSLRKRKPKLLREHNMSDVIGTVTAREDDKGLFVKGQILEGIQLGAETLALMRAGALDGMSIGFQTVKREIDEKARTRKLLEVDLWEVSIVTFPMQPDAGIDQVKNFTIRDVEKVLRDAGFSNQKAKAIASSGYKLAFDSVHRDDDLNEVLHNAAKRLRG